MRRLIMLALTFVLSISMIACSTTTPRVEYVPVPELYMREPLGIVPPAPINFEPVRIVYVEEEGKAPYFILDTNSYKNLLDNNLLIRNYIEESNGRIGQCEAYYTAPPVEGDAK